MIRFVDISLDLSEDGYYFAWFNTITCEFETHSGSMAWEFWDELENRLKVQFIKTHWARLVGEVNSWAKYVDRRISELKSLTKEGEKI